MAKKELDPNADTNARIPPALRARIDALRERQPVPPAREAYIRYLLELGIAQAEAQR